MTQIEFGRLQDLALREAWAHEAHGFTPWLAENIDHLSEAIGMPLELTGQEVAVETFSADILAQNPQDGTVVLIENQLEQTDHTHLGQIMTYLAGLDAQTVIWIASGFREPHLSAIRWLNEHTADGFSFFAVKLRVVRIGESPYAPIFEVLEHPDNWKRGVQKSSGVKEGLSERGRACLAFWTKFGERFPDLAPRGYEVSTLHHHWFPIYPDHSLVVTIYVGQKEVGLFVRGRQNDTDADILPLLEPNRREIEARLGGTLIDKPQRPFTRRYKFDRSDQAQWPAAMDWLHSELINAITTLTELTEQPE